MLLKNKTAVITGCNRGIGLSILETYYKNGAKVIACVRKNDENFDKYISHLTKNNQNKIEIVEFDLSDEKEIEKGFLKIKEISQHVDILINNAGINQISLFQMTKLKSLREIFEINFFSTYSFTQKVLKLIMKSKSGKIINISSNAATLCSAGRSGYAASKAAIIAFTKVLSKELGRHKICVNALAPGLTDTEMKNQTSDKEIQEVINQTPLNKLADPSEIANVSLFLASDLSNHVTGETIFVTGGY
jgi:3-oxoacyl-[acyl-carrier protein] reductase